MSGCAIQVGLGRAADNCVPRFLRGHCKVGFLRALLLRLALYGTAAARP